MSNAIWFASRHHKGLACMHGIVVCPWGVEREVDVFQGSTYPSYHYFYFPLAVTTSSIHLHDWVSASAEC